MKMKPSTPPLVTGAIVALNIASWLFVQGAGADLSLARSVCNLGLIPGELTGLLRAGRRLSRWARALSVVTDPGRKYLI